MIPRVFRERPDFRRLWSAETVSLFGDQVSILAVPLVAVLVLHAGAGRMGLLTATMLAPNLLFSLHFGALVDRIGHRRRNMIVADLGRAALLASIPISYLLGALTFIQLLAVGFAAGTLSVLFTVSQPTVFTSIVPRDRYIEANQLANGSRAFSFLAGPSLGGFLIQLFTAPLAVVVDALSFVGSAAFLARIRSREPMPETFAKGHLFSGLRFIAHNAIIRSMLVSAATINLFNFAYFALFVLFATRTLHVPPGTIGAVLGAGAVGSLIGSAIAGMLSGRIGIGPMLIVGSFLFPAPLVLVPMAGGPYPLILLCLFLAELGSGFGVMLLDIAAGSIHQSLVPEGLRARVSGAFMVVNYGVRPIGALTGGALAAWLGMRPALWIATVGAVVGVLFLIPSPMPTLRELPTTAD